MNGLLADKHVCVRWLVGAPVEDIDADIHGAVLAVTAARHWANQRLKEGVRPGPLAIAMVSAGVGLGLAQDGACVWARLLRGIADTLEQGGVVPVATSEDKFLGNH